MRPQPALLEQLSLAQLALLRAKPSVGVGERRSAAKGAGIEFAEHRPYRAGDDVRHLDPRVLARLGDSYIRQYFVDRQLPVYVLLDGSRSMQSGTPKKFETASQIAQLMAFVVLAAGDRVQLGYAADGKFQWSSPMQGRARTETLFQWVGDRVPGGRGNFGEALERASRDMAKGAYVVAISDWWDDGVERALDRLDDRGCDVVAIQVAAPEELDPAVIGGGSFLMVDEETGEELETTLDEDVLRRYRAALVEFQARLRQRLVRRGGRFFALSSALDIQRFFLRDLRDAGVLI